MMTLLLISLFFCHFLADFPLSTKWMLAAKQKGEPFLPILVHAGIHAALMGLVLVLFLHDEPNGWLYITKLIPFQWFTHFGIDVMKGKMMVWYPSTADTSNKLYWLLFGLDQFLHATVILLMVTWTIW
jgi:hypothetical protein